jgi:hypothetical protein
VYAFLFSMGRCEQQRIAELGVVMLELVEMDALALVLEVELMPGLELVRELELVLSESELRLALLDLERILLESGLELVLDALPPVLVMLPALKLEMLASDRLQSHPETALRLCACEGTRPWSCGRRASGRYTD